MANGNVGAVWTPPMPAMGARVGIDLVAGTDRFLQIQPGIAHGKLKEAGHLVMKVRVELRRARVEFSL